jgi:transcriptional regulator with XRE-family HTH domain
MNTKKSPKHKKIVPAHQKLMKKIGARIKKLRTDKKKGYVEMAEMIGISRNEYNLMELGKIYFKFSTLLRVLDYHKIKFSDFIKDL